MELATLSVFGPGTKGKNWHSSFTVGINKGWVKQRLSQWDFRALVFLLKANKRVFSAQFVLLLLSPSLTVSK